MKRLLNIINKVSRYKEASRFLYRTAKKYPRVRHMQPVIVVLPTEAFKRFDASQYDPMLLGALSRFRGLHAHWDLQQVCNLLKIKQQDAKNQFAKQAKQTVTEAKIHAEIQLLYHYEIEPLTLPPRIVCSSKDACYICNQFILMHGKMHTSRCHGKIYTGWRLPALPALQDLERRFNMMLDTLVETTLSTLLVKRKRITYPDPNESTLLSLPHSVSTASITARPVEKETSITPTLPIEDAKAETSYHQLSLQGQTMLPADFAAGPIGASAHNTLLSQSCCSSALSNASTSKESTSDNYIKLDQGHLVPGSTKTGALPHVISAGPLELIIEHSAEPTRGEPGKSRSKISYGIEWLESNETMQQLQAHTVIDIESLKGEVTYDVGGTFFVAGWGSIVKVSFKKCKTISR